MFIFSENEQIKKEFKKIVIDEGLTMVEVANRCNLIPQQLNNKFNNNRIAFTDLKEKEIINVSDGKKLGHIIDFLFDIETGQVKGIIVPGERKIFRRAEDIFIPLERIKKIGGDVILVKLRFVGGEEGVGDQRVENNLKTKYNLKNYYDVYNKSNYKPNGAQTTVRYNSYNNINSSRTSKAEVKTSNSSFVRFKPINNIKYK